MNQQPFLKRIKQHFPEITFKRSRILTNGWDNVAIILDNKIIFRFPRKRQNPQFKIELALNPFLIKRISSVPIPHYTFIPKDKSFVGYTMIQGKSITPERFKKIPLSQKQKIAKQLVNFLHELHRFPVPTARKCGVISAWSAIDARKWHEEQAIIAYKKMSKQDSAIVKDLIRLYDKNYNFKPQLAHQDLTWDNMLISKNKTVTGVIDFGDIQITDPAGDIGRLAEYGIDFMDLMIKYYRPKEKNFRNRAIKAYVFFSLSLLAFSVTMKRKDYWQRGYEMIKTRKAGSI